MSDFVWLRFYMCAIRLISNTTDTVCLPRHCVPTNWCRFISCLFRPRRRELPEYYSTSAYARRAARCIINLKLHCARERELVCCSEKPQGSHTHVYYMGGTVTRQNATAVSFPELTCNIVSGDFKALRATSSLSLSHRVVYPPAWDSFDWCILPATPFVCIAHVSQVQS